MAGVNKVILIGRLGRDPEVRNFQNGGRVVSMRLATSERYKDREGNAQEKTEWHSVSIFNEKLGEIAEKYLKKGSEVYIEGKLETRKYEKDGVEHYSTEVVLRPFNGAISLIGGRGDSEGGSGSGGGGGASAASGASGGGRGGWGGGGGAARGGASGGGRGGGWDAPAGGGRGASRGGSDLDDDIPFSPEWR